MSKVLANAEYILLIEDSNFLECLCPLGLCIKDKIFHIYLSNKNGEQLEEIGKWVESSSMMAKCCYMCWRNHTGIFTTVDNMIESKVEVPYRCHCPVTCLSCPCMNPFNQINMNIKPGAGISESDNIEGYGGKIIMPFYCIGKGRIKCLSYGSFNIQDNMDNLEFMIDATCCQKSVICQPLRCLGCPNIVYNIKNTQKNTVGKITNIFNGVYEDCLGHFDKFLIEFPEGCNLQKKVRLLQTTLFINYNHHMG